MKKLRNVLLAAAVPALVCACTDLSGVDNRLDSLDSRVSALEKAVDAINSNINALKSLSGNQTINKVEQDGDNYVITLGNGDVITIYQGTIGIGNTPVLSIDADGYWQVDYGSGAEPVLQNGAKVYALGEDGVTPLFNVNDDNYWIVSYDGGTTWQNVLYASGDNAGQKVKAYDAGAGDSYFHNVEYLPDEGVFSLTMKTGQVFKVPVVSGFLCSISDVDDVQKFDYGQTRTFSVTMQGVADYTLITPDGWSAVLQGDENAILAVTAPAASTKSVYADSESDVSIVAFTLSGLSTSAKMHVALTGQTYTVSPYTSPSKLEVGANDAKVRVLVENADEWYYLLSTSAEAPHAVEIIADGVKGTDQIFTVTGLKQKTTYYLYTTAIKDAAVSVVSYCTFTTGITDDRYQAWLDGEDIVIGDEHFSPSSYGTATLLTATQENDEALISALSTGGVIFIDTPEGTSFCFGETKLNKETIICGRYASSPAKINQTSAGRLILAAAVAFSFVEYSAAGRAGQSDQTAIHIQNTTGLELPFLLFGDCVIRMISGTTFAGFGYAASANNHVKHLGIYDCNVEILDNTSSTTNFFTTYSWNAIACIQKIIFRNNIFYAHSDRRLHLHFPSQNYNASDVTADYAQTVVEVSQNTFYGAGSDWDMVRCYSAGSITVKRNLCWQYSGSNISQFKIVDPYGQQDIVPAYEVENNISYGADFRAVGSQSLTVFPSENTVSSLLANPLPSIEPSTWNFTPATGFTKYGAQR